ncbi:MAG: diguanylate cyclase [Ruminococcus sp.]|nr:diguanylate cyclase [Ruminococcus sp.]
MDSNSNHSAGSGLYELAARCFALSFGYPSFVAFLKRSTYFSADITHNIISAIQLSEPASTVYTAHGGISYDKVLDVILTTWQPSVSDDDIRRIYSRDELINTYKSGISFLNHGYDCVISGEKYRKMISCQLSGQNGSVSALFLVYDITDIYDESARLLRRAEYDGLTGLLNKSAAECSISESLSVLIGSSGASAAVVIADLDNFKRFNDQYGHEAGDAVLRSAAQSLEKFFGRESVIGRYGGDEFIILLKNRTEREADEEIKAFSDERHGLDIDGSRVPYTFSIGYSMFPEQGVCFTELLERADMAMYNVKMNHRDDYRKFEPDMKMEKRTQLSFNLSDIVSGIPGAILVYKADEQEEILFANDRLYDLFECSSMAELLRFSGDSFKNIVHPDDLDRVEESITRQISVNSSGLDYVSYRIITKSGRIKYVDDIGHLVHTPKYGDIFYVFLYDKEQKRDILHAAGEDEDLT